MAQLRITVIQSASENSVVPSSDAALFCDQTVGISLEGPLETLLRNVAEYARMTDPQNVSLELVLDRRHDKSPASGDGQPDGLLAGAISLPEPSFSRRLAEVV